MELLTISKNIDVVFLKVPQFPKDVPNTYDKLHTLIQEITERRYFGISHADKLGVIHYKAAAEILPTDNFTNSDLEKFTITKGIFAYIFIANHLKNSSCIGDAFQKLLKHPLLDQNGYCLEIYNNYSDPNVQCMVRLISN